MLTPLRKAQLAATLGTLGRFNKEGQYVVDPQCFVSIKDLITYLRNDDPSYHAVRLYLGTAKVVSSDLVHIVKESAQDERLFDVAIRLIVNLTSPVILLYKEEIPEGKVGRKNYMQLISHSQEYKTAFCDKEFWDAVRAKLVNTFETDWAERSEDSNIQVERLLVLLRNVLQVPADAEQEHRPENDITIHDKLLWALEASGIFTVILYISSNRSEERYFLHLMEIISLLLREQNATCIAQSHVGGIAVERNRDAQELAKIREREKLNTKNFKNARNFHQTFVVKNLKSISNNDVVIHKSIDKLNDLKLTQDKKRIKTAKNRFPEDSERPERRSTFTVRLFLKEFCMEFLSSSFNVFMGAVKDKLVAGKSLANDESYYIWALRFFLEFSCAANVDIKFFSECISVSIFHFVQTQIEKCYDNMATDKKKFNLWVRRLHLCLKAYKSLLQTLVWMDSSKDQRIRDMSKVLKSNLFYVPEYRELMLTCLFKYDSGKFPLSFLRDLIETNHINVRLIEGYCKSSRIVVQRHKRVVKKSKKKKKAAPTERPPAPSPEEIWETHKDELYEAIEKKLGVPEIAPFDAASEVPIDEQKEVAMKNIQKKLRRGEILEAIGLLRSSRQVWPENDCFGTADMSVEEEVMALQEICQADLGVVYDERPPSPVDEDMEEEDEDSEDDRDRTEVVEQTYNIEDYLKKLVHKKVVEGACLLLSNYKKNTPHTNHCVVKLLHRIGWQCKVPAMMFHASFFITLNKILQEKNPAYNEMQQFAKQLFKKFRDNFGKNPKLFMELLFWKEPKIAVEIEEGYGTSENKTTKGTWAEEEEDELKRLWVEFDEKILDGDKIDWIKNNVINQDRSRMAIIKKLKELMLITPGAKVVRKAKGGASWSEDEVALLTQLFEQHKGALDVAENIRDRMMARSKKSIKDKLVEMGLVGSLADLRKRKLLKGRKSAAPEPQLAESSSESSNEEDVEAVSRFSPREAIAALKKVESMKAALEWLKESFTECIEDDEASEGCPLLPIDSAGTEAVDNKDFKELLRKLNVNEPENGQIYWKIRGDKSELHDVIELITAAIEGKLDDIPAAENRPNRGVVSDESDGEDAFDKLRKVLPNGNAAAALETVSSQHGASMSDEDDKDSQSPSSSGSWKKFSKKKNRSQIGSDDSDVEDDFEKIHKVHPTSHVSSQHGPSMSDEESMKNEDSQSPRHSGSQKKISNQKNRSRILGSDDSEDEVRVRHAGSPANVVDSDRSDLGEGSGEEQLPKKSLSVPKPRRARMGSDDSNHDPATVDSDRSDRGGASGEEMLPAKSLPRRRIPVLSDSDGDEAPKNDYWRQKRRRCIGSDSEVEGCASEEEMKDAPQEIRKKSRMLDSDSEVEGHGSAEDIEKFGL